MSESACLRRVRNLEELGVISGYAMLVDQSKAGYPSTVFVQISLDRQQREDLEKFERSVAEVPEVMECYLMTGEAGVTRVHSSFSLRTIVKKTEVPIR